MEATKRRKLCPHCTQNISYSAYLSHKARYFDSDTSEWTNAGIQPNIDEEPEEVDSDSDSSLTYDGHFDDDDEHFGCDNGRSDDQDATENREDCDDYEVLEVITERDMHECMLGLFPSC